MLNLSTEGPGGQTQQSVSVEDVMAFPKFATERFGLQEETAKVAAFDRLAQRMDPLMLGSIYPTPLRIFAISLTRCFGHGSSRWARPPSTRSLPPSQRRSTPTGMPSAWTRRRTSDSTLAEHELDEAMWELLTVYEQDLKLLEPLDPDRTHPERRQVHGRRGGGRHRDPRQRARVRGNDEITAQRTMPQSLQVQLNLPIQLPPGVDPSQLPAAVQQMLQQAPQAMLPLAQAAVSDAMKAQAPILGCQVRWLDARWREV